MCGIAGIIYLHRQADRGALEKMAGRLSHRGPDDCGFHLHGKTGLAQTRLSIIDLAGGHQPMVDAETGAALVANGEVYNFLELREDLLQEGASFATRSDSETILRGYLAHGTDYVRRLHGMFAFALHDPRSDELVLGRDRFGIKPLYYARLDDRLLFASELKALIPLLPGTPEIAPGALLQYLQNQFNTGEETILHGVRRLPPGELLIVSGDLSLRRKRYWSALDVAPRSLRQEEAEEEFTALFDQVMREHMRSDVPFGLFLSGGVDSGVLLAMLTRLQDRPLRTYSVGFRDAKMKDELSEATAIARRFETVHTELVLDRETVFHRLPHLVWATDDLLRDYACLPTSLLAECAANELKVVFSGEGGDEAFAGYGRYRPGRLEALAKKIFSGAGGFRSRGHWGRRWPQRVFGPALQSLGKGWRTPFELAWRQTPQGWSDMARRQYVDIQTNLPDDLLVKADRTLMGFGLEGRVPFLDHRVVEFGLSLPDQLKSGGGQGKLFLKKWAERYLPKEHLYQRKRGFHVPVGEWLRGDFLARLEDVLPTHPALEPWFRGEGIRELLRAQGQNGSASREIWGLLQIAIWHRIFIAGDGSAPPVQSDPLDYLT